MRTSNSIKNISTALIGQFLGIIVSFVSRAIFIKYLGMEYLGVSGLFANILSILSLAELGIGSAIIYKLYKPLALKNYKEVKILMNFYKTTYTIIGIIVLSIGLSIVPFLDYIIKDKPNIDNLTLIYLLYLLNSVCSYFYIYKKSLIIADQKNYITTMYKYGFYIMLNIVQTMILMVSNNFYLFLIIQIIATMLENIFLSKRADKMYPFLRQSTKEKLPLETKNEINRNIRAMMLHRIGGVIVKGTDNIIISSFVGVVWVALYSNYYLIINSVNIITNQIFSAVTASIGNLNALESNEKCYDIYNNMLFISFWISGFCSISLLILINPFINLWIGKQHLFSELLVLIIIINFYIGTIRKITLIYRDALGLFWHDRYKPIFESIINIVVSIMLAKSLGVVGVFIGTFISTITTAFWIEPYVLYKYGFKKSVKPYFSKYINHTIIILLAGSITYAICSIFDATTWITLIVKFVVCLLVPNLIFVFYYRKSKELNYFLQLFKKICKKYSRTKPLRA